MRNGIFRLALLMTTLAPAAFAQGGELRVPASVAARTEFSISTSGSGKATFYLIGPGHVRKQQVEQGEEVRISTEDTLSAGRYVAILCAENCRSASFYVTPSRPSGLSFLAHPSRVPVRAANAISGVAFVFDAGHNLILTPTPISFNLTTAGSGQFSRSVTTRNGVAWFRTNSGSAAGSAQLTASTGDVSVHRVVRQVAAEACNLRVKASRTKTGVMLETDPVRDCSGNPVPDGTIVTFTRTDNDEKSSVDAPIKQGVARAIMTSTRGTVSVASGVVMGNPIRLSDAK
jgi:hypothetical protein